MWQIWLIFAGIFIIVEIATTGFLIFWLAIGSIFAMITSIFVPNNIFLQTAVFVVSSALLIPFTKKLAFKFVDNNNTYTNSYSKINKRGIVTLDIDPTNGTGLVKVDGEIWSAKSEDNTNISINSEIEVLKIEGVKLIVKAIKVPSKI